MIRDRGKIKWNSAYFIPEHVKMINNLKADDQKEKMPILDEYQLLAINEIIYEAIEYAHPVQIRVWKDGFFEEYSGLIHRLDEINCILYLEEKDGIIVRLSFKNIVGIELK
ncbi:YolD-like family protein [Neobacillus sp. D3-1R]|uniref:YolD-like family protein n=1 Tax=Neobacillus sp. D3-1R TaxID=3445778 RepID=UPI003F9F3B58